MRLVTLFGVTLCLASAAFAELAVDEAIEQLDDADFARREAAVVALASEGADAIPSLVEAAQGKSPEAATRAVRLLENLMESADGEVIDSADAALVELTNSERPQAAALAHAVLERHWAVREERAVKQIRELGGQVQYGQNRDEFGRLLGGAADGPNDVEQPQLIPRTILLGKDWQGGTEQLVHLKKLSHRRDLVMYVVQGSSVPLEEAQKLASVLPGLVVNHRGPYLGVGATHNGVTECVIGEVRKDGPAYKAGLQPHDVVVSLNSQKIGGFHDLVETLKSHAEGETVSIKVQRLDPVLRRYRLMEIPVELGTWQLPPIEESAERQMFPNGMPVPPQLPQQPVR